MADGAIRDLTIEQWRPSGTSPAGGHLGLEYIAISTHTTEKPA